MYDPTYDDQGHGNHVQYLEISRKSLFQKSLHDKPKLTFAPRASHGEDSRLKLRNPSPDNNAETSTEEWKKTGKGFFIKLPKSKGKRKCYLLMNSTAPYELSVSFQDSCDTENNKISLEQKLFCVCRSTCD